MAEAACEHSDKVIFTSDNPRSEDPAQIIADMENGLAPAYKRKYISIIDRKEAIKTAIMMAGRTGSAITAEIGSMKVTEQLDALRMSGVLPIDYLLVPRFLASIVMTVALTILGAAIMYGAGGLTAWLSFGVNPRTFFDPAMVQPRHLALGLIKAVTYGAAIPIVAGFCGLRARGSSEGVGWATTAAVVGSSFAVIALDFALSVGALWVFGGDL